MSEGDEPSNWVSSYSIRDSLHQWPRLTDGAYEVTSPADFEYNCIAWALEEQTRWWSPIPEDIYYWPEPPTLEDADSLAVYVRMFQALGFDVTQNIGFQEGITRIALFADRSGQFVHVARQHSMTSWTSKIGDLEDIQHELAALSGGAYGAVALLMQRPECSA